jgi:hypothetical protein
MPFYFDQPMIFEGVKSSPTGEIVQSIAIVQSQSIHIDKVIICNCTSVVATTFFRQHRARNQRGEHHLKSHFHPGNPRIKMWLKQASNEGPRRGLYVYPRNPKLRSDYAYHLHLGPLTSYAEEERPDDATFSIGVVIVAVTLSEVWQFLRMTATQTEVC